MMSRAFSSSVCLLMLSCLIPAPLPAASMHGGAVTGLPQPPSIGSKRGAPAFRVLYVSDFHTDAINVFRLDNGRQIGSIAYPMSPGGKKFSTGGGVATDAENNLWASFSFDNGRNFPGKIVIYKYAPGQSRWLEKIDGGCCGSPNLAVSNRGEIAEALSFFPPDYAGGAGFIEPDRKFAGSYNTALAGITYEAYDLHGTLWIAGVDVGFKTHFGYIPHGTSGYVEVHCKAGTYMGPMAVDAAGNMIVDNDQTVYAYDGLGNLMYTVPVIGAVGVANIALSPEGTMLYVAKQNGTVLAYAFPGGGKPLVEYAVGGRPNSIALGSI